MGQLEELFEDEVVDHGVVGCLDNFGFIAIEIGFLGVDSKLFMFKEAFKDDFVDEGDVILPFLLQLFDVVGDGGENLFFFLLLIVEGLELDSDPVDVEDVVDTPF